ncbi:MAG: hypothetical protein RL026_377 [Pseudomonadota bacterium]
MRYLFIHQNFPGQFRHMAAALAADPGNEVLGMGDAANLPRHTPAHPAVKLLGYSVPAARATTAHPYLKGLEEQTRRGQAVARALLELKAKGFVPDVIAAHPAWGEALFIKDIFPAARLVVHCEFFYRSHGSDMNFDPEFPSSLDSLLRLRLRNAVHLLSLEAADLGVSPTAWQRQQFPAELQAKIAVTHEGVDTQKLRPDGEVVFGHGDVRLTRDDEVLTYVARNLEPYRGFHSFMRALPRILQARPKLQVLVVGGLEVSYGLRLPEGQTYKDRYWNPVRDQVDASRVHFLGKLPYEHYMRALQVSRCHLYLTYPFVLSWSLLEAMACACPIVASATAPVTEVVRDGHNGRLTDFFDATRIADDVLQMLGDAEAQSRLGAQARADMVARYDLQTRCVPDWLALLRGQSSSAKDLPA